jgi:hypothetical protein
MSYPPDPQAPYGGNPYAQPQQPQQPGAQPGYGYPQQPAPQPGYGYPPPPGSGVPGMPQRMQGQVVTARVLMFVSGSLWAVLGIVMLIVGLAAEDAVGDLPGLEGGAALGMALIVFLIFGGLGALHIVPAAMFGKGGSGTRITAIIASSLNSLFAVLALLGALGSMGNGEAGAGGQFFVALLWAATAVVTVVFLSMRQAGTWFNRPRY